MKKKIICIGIIGMFLLTSFSVLPVLGHTIPKSCSEDDIGRAVNILNGGNKLDPAFFKDWKHDDYTESRGQAVTFFKNHIYIATWVYEYDGFSYYNGHVAIYKFDLDGNIIKSIVFEDFEAKPNDMIVYKDHLYVAIDVSSGPHIGNTTILKFDADLNIKDVFTHRIFSQSFTIPYAITAEDDYIYVTGGYQGSGDGQLLYVARINIDTGELNKYKDENVFGKSGSLSEGGGIVVYGNYVYVSGISGKCNPRQFCILRYKKDDLFSDTYKVFTADVEECEYGSDGLGGIVEHNGYLYVAGEEHIDEGSKILLAKFDTGLNPVWDEWKKTYDIGEQFTSEHDCVFVNDIIIYNGNIYIGGSIFHFLTPYNGKIMLLKCNIEGEEQWLKKENDCIFLNSITTDNNGYLYLTGLCYRQDKEKAYLLKCNEEGSHRKEKPVVSRPLYRLQNRFPLLERLLQLPIFTSFLNRVVI